MAAKAMTTAVRKARLFGSGGNINLIAAKLHRHKERLRFSLKKRGHELQPEVRKKFEAILKALTISSALVGGIPCQGPFMSLDLPKSKGPRSARSARARRRR
jgi:hypothetical protein